MSRPRETARKAPEQSERGADRPAFVGRLQTILRHWPSADRLARAVGVSPSAFRKWLRGEAEPSRERLVALADAAGVGVAWLAKGDGPEPRFPERAGSTGAQTASSRNDGGIEPAPVRVAAEARRGGGGRQRNAAATLAPERVHRLRPRLDPKNVRVGAGRSAAGERGGQFMQPTIRDNDLLLIDTTDRKLREFGIYVLEYQGERLVKRVQRKLDGSLILISDNAIYEAERIPAERANDVTVIGRAVWSGGRI